MAGSTSKILEMLPDIDQDDESLINQDDTGFEANELVADLQATPSLNHNEELQKLLESLYGNSADNTITGSS